MSTRAKLLSAISIIAILCFTFSANNAIGKPKTSIGPTDLRCEHMTNPSTVDNQHPRLSWINIAADENAQGEYQSAYQIQVASTAKKLEKGKADIWDTRKVDSQESYLIDYAGKPLQSGLDYYWRVRVWDKDGKASNWSEPAHWGMGLLTQEEWKAQWIGSSFSSDEGLDAAPLYRKTFTLNGKKIAKAKAFVSGLGFFELYVNGKRVSDDCLVPGISNFSHRPLLSKIRITVEDNFTNYRVLYLSYDITDLLNKGENAVGAILGNSVYNTNNFHVLRFGKPCLICQIEVTYEDGTKEMIVTDSSWRTHKSAIVMNDTYAGEIYDATKESNGWATTNFNDSDWEQVTTGKGVGPDGILSAQTAPTDKVTERVKPISVTKRADGTFLAKFDKEMAGWLRFNNIVGKLGDTLKVHFICEYEVGTEQYMFKDSNPTSYAPRFTWYTFTEAEISGVKELTVDNITAEAVNTDVKQDSQFGTSNALFTKINDIWIQAQKENMHGCISSDCANRERIAYLGDGQLASLALMHNFDASAFYVKWFRDMRDCQDKDTGYVPNAAPWQPYGGGGVAWGAGAIIMPWNYYLQYGDRKVLSDSYETMKGYVRYMLTWLTPDNTMFSQRCNIGSTEPNIWFNLGEWNAPYDIPPQELYHTYFLWKCSNIIAKSAKKLGHDADYEYYSKLAARTREAFNKKFYDPKNHTYGDFGANLFGLSIGVPEGCKADVVETLRKELTEKYNKHINTGIFGCQLLFTTLAQNGLSDLAYDIMNQTDYPSFGLWVKQGATTMWETWSGKDSHVHTMFGAGLVWFYNDLAGVNVDENEPGYRHVIIRPLLPSQLDSARYSHPTPYGKVVSEVVRHGSQSTLDVTIPVGSHATIYLPDGSKPIEVQQGHYKFTSISK